MLKLIIRTALALVATTALADAMQLTPTGHVTFVDSASNQLLVDNQLVVLDGDLTGMSLRLGDEVALAYGQDTITALLEPNMTGAIAKDPVAADAAQQVAEQTAVGIITYFDAQSGLLVLNNTVAMVVDTSGLAIFQVGETAEAHYNAIGDTNFASTLTTFE